MVTMREAPGGNGLGGVKVEQENADEGRQEMGDGLDGAVDVAAALAGGKEEEREGQMGGALVGVEVVDLDTGVDGGEEEEEEAGKVAEVKQQHVSCSSSSCKDKEVICISDEESSDSWVKAKPVVDEGNSAARLLPLPLPDVVKVEPGGAAPEDEAAAPWRGKEPMLVPKAEVIYGGGVVGSGEDAASREVALAKVAAEWEQFGMVSPRPSGTTTGSLCLSPNPLASREPAGPGDAASQPLRAGTGKNPNIRTTHEGPRRPAVTVGSYTVQCCACHKWRWVPNKQVYEHIREMNSRFPFRCEYAHHWWPDCSCEKPAEITAGDVGFVWAMDKSNISRPPPGWERKVVIRGEGSLIFSDVYYLTPDGRTMRSMNDIVKFLADHPEEDASLAQFNFSRPRPMDPKLQRKRRQELLGAGSSGSPAHKLLRN